MEISAQILNQMKNGRNDGNGEVKILSPEEILRLSKELTPPVKSKVKNINITADLEIDRRRKSFAFRSIL